jgi:hypothetical protein
VEARCLGLGGPGEVVWGSILTTAMVVMVLVWGSILTMVMVVMVLARGMVALFATLFLI